MKRKKIALIVGIALFGVVGLISLITLLIGGLNPDFAETITVTVGHFFRMTMSKITGIFSFSVAEIFVVSFVILTVAFIIFIFLEKSRRQKLLRNILIITAIFSFFITTYTFTLGIGYKRVTVAQTLSLEGSEKIDVNDLYQTLLILKTKVEQELDSIIYSESGFSVSPYTTDELSKLISEAYLILNEDYPELKLGSFSSRIKPAMSSELFLLLQITGMYTFYTGESNLNVKYPDYVLPFTVAHEFAHQRGISRENEANFIAFLACIRSDSPYIRYCGYLNMLEYVASSLARTDKELWKSFYSELDDRIVKEMEAYTEFYYENKNEFFANVSTFFNDNYLKLQGTEGIVSYGLVTELCVEYYKGR